MLMLETLLNADDPRPPADSLTLAFELRRRARLRTRLDSGREVGLMLERGLSLKHGDRLASREGDLVVEVRAQREVLSTVAMKGRRKRLSSLTRSCLGLHMKRA